MKHCARRTFVVLLMSSVFFSVFYSSASMAQESLFTYLIKQGFKQGGLLLRAKPVSGVLNDNTINPRTKKFLRLSQDVLNFAHNDLGMKTGKSYRKFIQLDRSWVTQIVVAAQKNSMEPYLFSYPIMGKLPYKGFFDEADAIELEETLKKQNLDTYRRPVEAFSTTGWLPDPILSTMLGSEARFIELLFHELTHATFYFKEEADFNEAFASWMGFRGAIQFVEQHRSQLENPDQLLKELNEDHIWQLRFAKVIKEVLDHAKDFYARQSNVEHKDLAWRDELFQWIKNRFANERGMERFANQNWNNAYLNGLGTYYLAVEPIDSYAKAHQLSPAQLLKKVAETGPSIIAEISSSKSK